MNDVLDHQKSKDAVEKSNGFVVSKNRQKKNKITTKGWKVMIRWEDGVQSWDPLADLKESYPVQLDEYTKLCEIEDEPAFSWWVPLQCYSLVRCYCKRNEECNGDFKILGSNDKSPVGFSKLRVHLVFVIKLVLTHKA